MMLSSSWMKCTDKRTILTGVSIALVFIPLSSLAVTCTVSTQNVAFGEYNPFKNNDTRSKGKVSVQCSAKTSFTISLGTGLGGSYSPRNMFNGSNQLQYNLYTNNNRTKIWGDGTSGTFTKSFNRKKKNQNIFGKIFAGQNMVPVGTYTDTVVATVDY